MIEDLSALHLAALCNKARADHVSPVMREREDEKTDAPTILTTSFGRLFGPVGTFSTFRTVKRPSAQDRAERQSFMHTKRFTGDGPMTRPKTVCLPSRNSAGSVVMKNWQLRGRGGGAVGRERAGLDDGFNKSDAKGSHPFVSGPELA